MAIACVERRQVLFQVLLDVVVMVPVAGVDRDAGAPRLDQAAGEQGPLAVEVPAVAVAQAGVFSSMSNACRTRSPVTISSACALKVSSPSSTPLASMSRRRVSNSLSSGGARPYRLEGKSLGESEVGDPEVGRAGVGTDLERLVRRTQVECSLIAEGFGLRDRHIRRHVSGSGADGAGDHRAERRLLRRVAGQRRAEVAGLHPVGGGGVDRVAVVNRADEREPVHHPRLAGEPLGDEDSGGRGGDRPVRPAKLRGGVGLQVVGVLLAHAAVRPEDDQRTLARTVQARSRPPPPVSGARRRAPARAPGRRTGAAVAG